MMLLHLQTPAAPLNRLVESLTLVIDPAYPYLREQILPDGAVDLLINLGAHCHYAIEPGSTVRQAHRRAWISGERRGPVIVERALHGYDLMIVRFRPGGAAALFAVPMCELTDRVIDLDELWGNNVVDDLLGLLHECTAPEQRLLRLEQWLAQRSAGAAPSALLARGIELLGHGVGVRELAHRLGTSQSTLLRLFQRDVGLNPKLLQRILRFQRAIQFEHAGGRTWSEIAYTAGYFDHAHLDREFRTFAGLSPSSYSRLRSEYPNYIPVT